MICLKQKSRMAVIVGHEIYGINAHMTHFCESLAVYGFDVWCPNLLNLEKLFDYSEEQAAYHHFMTKIGVQAEARKSITF
jgi:dienelactone hydrolase